MASTKRAESIRQEKAALRQHIIDIQSQIVTINKVPARVLNGSHQEAVGWKENFFTLKSSRFAAAPPREESHVKASTGDQRRSHRSVYVGY